MALSSTAFDNAVPDKVRTALRNSPSLTTVIIDELIVALWAHGVHHSSRENALAITKLQEAKFWLCEDLARRNNGSNNSNS